MVSIWEKRDRTWEIILITIRQHINYLGIRRISVKQKSIKTYKKKTNLKISLNNLEKIE